MKLLLGEDMSGHGKGVSSAQTLSNAITNLAGFFFNLFHFVLQISIRFLICALSNYQLMCVFLCL